MLVRSPLAKWQCKVLGKHCQIGLGVFSISSEDDSIFALFSPRQTCYTELASIHGHLICHSTTHWDFFAKSDTFLVFLFVMSECVLLLFSAMPTGPGCAKQRETVLWDRLSLDMIPRLLTSLDLVWICKRCSQRPFIILRSLRLWDDPTHCLQSVENISEIFLWTLLKTLGRYLPELKTAKGRREASVAKKALKRVLIITNSIRQGCSFAKRIWMQK